MENQNNRRAFLKVAALSAVSAVVPECLQAIPARTPSFKDGDGFTFLFQGDSITDGNRTRNNDWNHVMGHGYAYLIASQLGYNFPKKGFRFFNRGLSGNKVSDLSTRWQKDTLELKPDVLSILIGINDIAAFVNGNKIFTTEHYYAGYRALIVQTKQQLPDIRLVLCEPFILPVGKVNDNWELYRSEIIKRREIVRQLAAENDAIFVDFQNAFNKALSKAPADYWIWDGIHPMPAGHQLMARAWMHQVGKKIKFIK